MADYKLQEKKDLINTIDMMINELTTDVTYYGEEELIDKIRKDIHELIKFYYNYRNERQ